MGYSRGSRGKADKAKLCGICFAPFPDAQERKVHYKKYNCRDSMGQLGGLVETGRCLRMKERNLQVERDRIVMMEFEQEELLEKDVEMEFPSSLMDFVSPFSFPGITFGTVQNTTPALGASYEKQAIFHAKGLDVVEYTNYQAPKAGARNFLAPDRVMDAELLTKVVRTAIVNPGFGNPSFDYTGLGGDEFRYRFDKDGLFADDNLGLARFISAGSTAGTRVEERRVPPLTEGDIDIMAQALSDEWCEWIYFEEDYEEALLETFEVCFPLVVETEVQKLTSDAEPTSPVSVLDSADSYLPGTKWVYDSDEDDYVPVAPVDHFHNKKFDLGFVDYCDLEYQEQPAGSVYTETWFIDGCLPGPWFMRGVPIDETVVCEKIPLIGKSPLELMIQYHIEPTGDLLLDIQRALFAYYEKEALQKKKFFDLNGVPTLLVFEDWRADLRYCLYAPFIQGDQLKHLAVVINSPLPGWLVDFPKRRKAGVLQASGWNPLRYFTKQATLGFLDGVVAKLRELLGPVINAAGYVWDLVIKAKDYAFSMLDEMISKRGEILKALLQPLLYVSGFLIFLGSLKGLQTIVEKLGVPLAVLTAAAIGIGVYILVQFLGQAHMGALRRSTKIWEIVQKWDKPSEVKRLDEEIIEILAEESPEKEEWLRELMTSPHSVPECVIDLTHMKDLLGEKCSTYQEALNVGAPIASSPGMLFGSGFIWKILLLLCPLSMFGVSKTLSCAKDLITIQGGQDAAGRFFQDIVGGTQEVFYTLTGSKSEFLDYIYATVGVDFQAWRAEVMELTTATPTSIFLGPQERLKRLRSCKASRFP